MNDAPTGRTALLVIDVQDSFRARPERWARRHNPAFEANVARLVDAFRAAGEPVVFVLHEDDDAEFKPDSGHVRVMDFLEVRPGEPTLRKTTRGTFASTDLAALLGRLEATRLVVTGIQTEQCCETTTREAGDRGYAVDFVTEATLTFPIPHWAGGPELPAEEVARRTEYALAGRFARIRTVDEVVADLAREAGTVPA